jgi:hypothetical protein
MKNKKSRFPKKRPTPWEYVVRDILEMVCALKEKHQIPLLKELKLHGGLAKDIEIQSAFSSDKRLISIVREAKKINEHWLYYPGNGKIEKHHLPA